MNSNITIEFFKFISNLKLRAQKDAANPILSREVVIITYDYYNNLYSNYFKKYKDNYHILAELEELKSSIDKLKSKI